MENEHLACPKCGYDLYGIPEVRCPECGFGFDYAALRALEASAELMRFAAARAVIPRAALAGALSAYNLTAYLSLDYSTRFVVVSLAVAAALVLWAVFTGRFLRSYLSPGYAILLMWVVLLWSLVLTRLPGLVQLAATIMLVWAWLFRLRVWPALPRVPNAPPTDFRRSVDRYSIFATCILLTGSVLTCLAWVC